MARRVISVVGATGAQGGGVARALLKQDEWQVRAVTRNTGSEAALKLAELGCEIAEADLNSPATLVEALQGSYGLFAVTNFWDRATRMGEFEQGKNRTLSMQQRKRASSTSSGQPCRTTMLCQGANSRFLISPAKLELIRR